MIRLPQTRPEAILFDLMDTLLDERFDPFAGNEAVCALCKNLGGLTVEDVQREAERITADRERMISELFLDIPIGVFQRQLYEGLGLMFDVPIEALSGVFWKHAVRLERAEPGVLELLQTLDVLGIRYGVVSNLTFPSEYVREALALHGLGRFEFVMVSCEYGVRKPHEDFYRVALKKLGLSAEKVWYMGDRWWEDVWGPGRVGMFPVWYKRKLRDGMFPRARHEELEEPEHWEIDHWDEVTAWLKNN